MLGFLTLVLVPSKSDSEIKTWTQGVSLGCDPRKTGEKVGEVRQGGKKTNKGCVNGRGIFVSLELTAH